jgi:hypothetical protein
MNIKILGSSDYCQTIEGYLTSGSIGDYTSYTITKDSGSTPSMNSYDVGIVDGTDSTLCTYVENNVSSSDTHLCIANVKDVINKEWKNYTFNDRTFTNEYPNEYLVVKLVEYNNMNQ